MKKNDQFLLEKFTEPVFKKHSIAVSVKRIFTDFSGTVVDKALVPASLQESYPVYLFGEYDRQGGYFVGNRSNPPVSENYKYLFTYVWGVGNPFFFGFNILSDIQSQILPGDLVSVYTDSLTAPSFFVYIVQHVSKASIASITDNTKTQDRKEKYGMLNVAGIQYFTDNELQWQQPITTVEYDGIGRYKFDYVNPYQFKTPEIIDQNYIEMPLKFPINQYSGLNTYILFDTDFMQFNIKLKL